MGKEGVHGEAERAATQKGLYEGQEKKEARQNPHGFSRIDMVGQRVGVGALFHKGDKWGYMEWTEEEEDESNAPIREVEHLADDADVSQEVLDSLQEVPGEKYAVFGIGTIDGRLMVVNTERWGQGAHPDIRTADGWVNK